MNKWHYTLTLIPVLMLAVNHPFANAQDSYPVVDKVAQKVISNYQSSSCEQLMEKRMQPPSSEKAQAEQKAVQMMRNDPNMRKHFLNKVAGPIANKMFECGMIP